jgi:uroporphyrinogen decarboxylase
VSAGFDGLQCIEPAAGMSMSKIRQQYGKDLCLMGNVDPALLSDQSGHGNAELGYDELRRAVTDLMAPAVGRGGFIFGSCSGLHTGMWPERVNYMYQLATELDRAVCCYDSLSYSY